DVVTGVVDDGEAVEYLPGRVQAAHIGEERVSRGDMGKRSGQHVDIPCEQRVLQLPGPGQIEAEFALDELLLVGEIRLVAGRRVIADSVESRRAVTVVDDAEIDRPAPIAQPAFLILRIDAALHPLLGFRREGPLLVGARIIVDAGVRAPAEIRVVYDVRRNHLTDVLVLIRLQPRGDDPERRAAVRIDRDLRNREEGRSGGIEPAEHSGGRGPWGW